jgi:DNA-binding transcriptional LysR family regulator
VLNDLATKLAICAAGYGVSQTFELGVDELIASGALVQILRDWAEERFPLYVYYPSRHHPPAKVRAFLDFVLASVGAPAARSSNPRRRRGKSPV